jgi:hypothetical protein
MNAKQLAAEVLDRLRSADDIVIRRQDILEQALLKAFNLGLERAALYVSEEVGTAHAADDIRRLPSCF